MKTLILILSIFLLTSCKAGFEVTNDNYKSGNSSVKCKTVQCYAKTKSGNRCKNITSNCSGRCHVH